MTANKSIVFELPGPMVDELNATARPIEALVTVWGDDTPTIALRVDRGTWGPPVDASHVEGEWPPSQETPGAILRALDHISASSLLEGNVFANDANAAADRYDDGNDRSLGVALVQGLLAVAAELRATRGAS